MKETKLSPQSPDYIGATILICLGITLLLSNLGLVSPHWAELFRFWPILIVLLGLNLLTHHDPRTQLTTSFLIFIFFSLFILTKLNLSKLPHSLQNKLPHLPHLTVTSAQAVHYQTFSLDESDFDPQSVNSKQLDLNASRANLSLNDTDSTAFFQVKAKTFLSKPQFIPNLNHDNLTVKLTQTRPQFTQLLYSPDKIDITLGKTQTSTSINLNLDSGSAQIILDQTLLEDIQLKIGLGSATISLTGSSAQARSINLNINTGSANLILPESTSFTISADIRLGSLTVNGQPITPTSNYTHLTPEDPEPLVIKASLSLGSLHLTTQ